MANTKKYNALIFDTRSIQNYIYSGNLLRTNIGASYIVDRIFSETLIETLEEIFPKENFSYAEDTAWDNIKDDKKLWENMKNWCVAYIGGGNAWVLFDAEKEDKRREVVKNFTLKLLTIRPGLKVGVAFGELNELDGNLNQDGVDALYAKLKDNQNNIFPAVNVPYSGLTLSCEINGETANFCDAYGKIKPLDEIRFYSMETAVKADISADANKSLKSRFDDIFKLKNSPVRMKNFDFPMEIDKLGQKTGENYFSIVHVDGNNMGVKFSSCKNLTDRRRLSREIRRKTEGAFADLLLKIIAAKENGLFDKVLNFTDEKILPIRPLIIGGDDVTFICPANMAIIFTKTLMEILNAETSANSPEHSTQIISSKMDCCAGIAILPTAYPFFRGYKLSEQLCDEAKKSMRKLLPKNFTEKDSLTAEDLKSCSSWLDFAILHGEQAPTLEQIRKREYTGARGNLHFGPYQVANKNQSRYNIENLLSCTAQFLESKNPQPPKGAMAHGKIKELRGILQRGKDDATKFLLQLKKQNQNLPEIADWKNCITDALWSTGESPRTPYVDAIELMDFYPPEVAEKWQSLT